MKKYVILLLALVLVVIYFLVFNSSPYDNNVGDLYPRCDVDTIGELRDPFDNCGGDQCPKCKSTHVGQFFYGLEIKDSATQEKIEKGILIPGGCVINDDSPRSNATIAISCGENMSQEDKSNKICQ